MPLLDYSVLNISSCCCFLGKNEILSKSWWKIVESEYYSGMEHSLSHLAAITESKKSLHPSCFILKLIRIFDTAWQSWILRQMARPQECVWSRVGAKREVWVGPVWASSWEGEEGERVGPQGWPDYPGSGFIWLETRQIEHDEEHMWSSGSKTIKPGARWKPFVCFVKFFLQV